MSDITFKNTHLDILMSCPGQHFILKKLQKKDQLRIYDKA